MDQPLEILVFLFKHLSGSDRLAASETCKLWYFAANDTKFLNKKHIVFYKTIFDEPDSSILQTFEQSTTPYPNYVFQELEISPKISEFWDKVGDNIRSLTLINCDLCEKVFISIVNNSPYLETLKLESCPDLFMSGRLMDDGLHSLSLSNLRSLSLAGNRFLSDAIFMRFANAAPNLEDLDLSSCAVSFHSGLFKKFYPFSKQENGMMTASESILTFHFILDFIVSRARKLKKLSFCSTLIDSSALKSLSMVDGLKLDVLRVHTCDQLTNAGIIALTSHQKNLRVLDIGTCSRVTDQSLLNICKNLSKLESLNLQRCRAITDIGIAELGVLNHLKVLNISQCELVSGNGLANGICKSTNTTLLELDISALNLDEHSIIMISEKLPNLRKLNVSSCFNAITDTSIQSIFTHQVWLRTLNISYCDKVSDVGLTGMGRHASTAQDIAPSFSCVNQTLDCSTPKINLGSKAENEIVRDAQRKRDVMMMCEAIANNSFTGYSLSTLKGLIELDMKGCNRITDVSLQYAFDLNELVTLDLSLCQQITHEGLDYLVKQCKSLESLKLVDCYNIKDIGVSTITKGLQRLKELHLGGCNQLTDKALESIRSHCERLRYLDVRRCRNLSPELANSLNHISTLQTVLTSKPGPYLNEVVEPPPPPPAAPRFSFRRFL